MIKLILKEIDEDVKKGKTSFSNNNVNVIAM